MDPADVFFPALIVIVVGLGCLIMLAVVSGQPCADGPTVSAYARTVNHDGHQFVVARGTGGIVHHPSCKCRLTPAEKE